MRAAIYARRSTDHQEASIPVQLEEARRYIEKQGWSLDDRHVYIDDALSRMEYKKRPALFAMLVAAEEDKFDVIVLRDVDRLGGDANRNGVILSDLIDRQVRVDEYLTKNRVKLDSAISKFMSAAKNFGAELEREKTSQRTHETLLTKARRGLNVGGRCYGFNNERVYQGEKHVETRYVVNDEQAKVVREMFEWYAAGWGLKRITRELNARKLPSPQAGKRGTGSWSPSVVRPMLRRERYRGMIHWGEFEKTYCLGTKTRVRRAADDEDRVRGVEMPELRIVSDELWFAVQARFKDRAQRSPPGRVPKYLLSGLGRCSECGGPMTVITGKSGNEPVKVYTCSYFRNRGEEVCTSSLRRPIAGVDAAVIDWVKANVLSEDILFVVLQRLRQWIHEQADTTSDALADLERDAGQLRQQVDRLVTALASTDEKSDAIVAGIAERQERIRQLDARIRACQAAPQAIDFQIRRMEADAKKIVADIKETLAKSPKEARDVLSTIFDGRITFTPVEVPEGKRFQLEGQASTGRLHAVEAGVSKRASPEGFEPSLAT